VELRHLRYFVAVAEELHFPRAAERLYVAQPVVSEQIRKLEAKLGVTLFDRTNRRVALTEAGAALLEHARRVLHHADVAQRAARNAQDRRTLQLRTWRRSAARPRRAGRAPRCCRSRSKSATRRPGCDWCRSPAPSRRWSPR
jgi:DNA-binding transcriptional LysR family regulator